MAVGVHPPLEELELLLEEDELEELELEDDPDPVKMRTEVIRSLALIAGKSAVSLVRVHT